VLYEGIVGTERGFLDVLEDETPGHEAPGEMSGSEKPRLSL